jgi:tetratricopeptide (TPR) repeat protein
MERPKHIIISIILILITIAPALASRKTEIYQAYIYNKMERWQNIIDKMEREKISEKDYLSQLVNFQYGYIGYCIGNDKTDLAKEYLDKAEKNLELLSKENANPSVIHAYESAFYGFKIGFNRLRAPFYGPRSIKHAELAIELDKKNPLGYIQYGNSQFYMPSIFGGSKEEAIKYFRIAQELMEQDSEGIRNNWNYLSLLTLIAQSFEEMKQYKNAQDYYEKVLTVEPNFSWVKNELYPSLLEKMNNKQ